MIAAASLIFARFSALLDGAWLVLIGLFLDQAARRALVRADSADRIRDVTVADIMDTRAGRRSPARRTLLDVEEHYFSRHRWPWFAVVDDGGHYRGLLRRERVEQELADGRPALTAAEVSDDAPPWRIDTSATLEALLSSEGLRRCSARSSPSTATACCGAS